jgi:zinc protease
MKSLYLFACLWLASLPLLSLSANAALKLHTGGDQPNYLFEHDPQALASSVQLVFRTGSMADPKGKEGLGDLAFHALLRGTKQHDKDAFFGTLERLGASLDVDVGAGRTIITLNTVSDNFDAAVALMAEAVLEPALKDDEIKALKEETAASLQQELTNNRRILKRVFRQALFHDTSLSFPPEGTLKAVESLTADDVRAFLAAQVKSGDAIVAVSSNRSEADVKAAMEKSFSALPEGGNSDLPMPHPAKLEGRTLYIVDRPGSATTEIAIGHFGITAPYKDRDTLETGLYSFGEDMSSMLFQELREKKGWTYGAAGGFDLFERPRRYVGGFMVWAFPQAEHTEELVLRALEVYQDYAQKGLDDKHLAFAKKSLANSYPFKFATSRSRLTVRLYELLEGSPHHDVAAYRKIVNGVTRKSLLAAIKKVHDPENVAIVLVGDPARTAPLMKSIPRLKKTVRVSDPMGTLSTM